MQLSIGIVGLPNVGKSTLFQTITKKQVNIANYPFCTIDPNVGIVAVPDERVDKLAKLTNSAKKIYAAIEFYDIAGLVKGASQGEGLGNKFLANIRETDAVIYVLRAFPGEDIITVGQEINPLSEKETLETELILKDMETVEKRLVNLESDLRAGKKEAVKEAEVLKKAKVFLDKGQVLNRGNFTEEEKKLINQYQLLTIKPSLFLLNGKDEDVPEEIIKDFIDNGWHFLIIDILSEFQAIGINREERVELGLPAETEFDLLIKKSYEMLGLITFFTTGPDETRAWTIERGSKVPQAGGVIHSDFEKYFIKAEVIGWQEFLNCGGFSQAKEKGLIRTEGKEYIVSDGDIIEIKH